MEIRNIAQKVPEWIKKYRYPILILAIGLVLMWLPGKGEQTQAPSASAPPAETQDLASELGAILGKIEGAGKVQVMLTVAAGKTTIYQMDEDDTGTAIRKDTVIITDSNRNQQALIQQVLPESYRGAIIVCQGADSPSVKLAIVEAVSRATGLGADNISVLKMK